MGHERAAIPVEQDGRAHAARPIEKRGKCHPNKGTLLDAQREIEKKLV